MPDTKENRSKAIGTYVFSPGFYQGDRTNMTVFEQTVMDYIEGKQLNIEHVMMFYKEFPSWSTEEKYYKLPILTLLLKDYLASMKTQI